MTLTPEGKIKKLVSNYLRRLDTVWYTMPVPGGYGMSTLDYLGCYRGKFFAIETKAPGKKPTPRQEITMEDMNNAGAAVFIIDSDDLTPLKDWVEKVKKETTT
jgi:hypothetical protein